MENKLVKFLAIALFGSFLSGENVTAAPFQNGSFEILSGTFSGNANGSRNTDTSGVGADIITGWNIIGNIDYVHNDYWESADGNYSLDLSGWGGPNPSTIFQHFDTQTGQDYLVLFDMAGNPEGPPLDPNSKSLGVSIGSDVTTYNFIAQAGSNRNMGWEKKTFFFTAEANTTTLYFTGYGETAYGVALDNVQIYKVAPVPEPTTALIFGAGLASFVMFARRRS